MTNKNVNQNTVNIICDVELSPSPNTSDCTESVIPTSQHLHSLWNLWTHTSSSEKSHEAKMEKKKVVTSETGFGIFNWYAFIPVE